MDLIYGIAGVISLTFFAAVLGFDVRDLTLVRGTQNLDRFADEDPNSTMSVTRMVVAEQLEQLRTGAPAA